MLGGNVRRNPELVRRAVAEGHEVAAHGELHWPLAVLPPWALSREVKRCAEAIERACGVRPRLYRPAFGFMMPGQAAYVRALGFESVLGDVYPEDPRQPDASVIVARVFPRLRCGSILILHDGSPFGPADRHQTVLAVPTILKRARADGLEATTVSDLLGLA
jgi:peptidoglycan/xylan/chitin deacetylase (PgdA/CDA1 family)